MSSSYLLIAGLLVFALAYRYYAAFLAARVAVIDAERATPALEHADAKDYHKTHRWVLFGHHFAAIAGAGPLIGPVLAAQYGYLPGAIWILFGAVFIGGVQDYVILHASVRHKGESISLIAERYLGRTAAWCSAFATLFIIIVALAGLALVVVNALAESPWGTFAIAATIPIALLMGQWLYRVRPGRVAETSVIGVVLLAAAVIAGRPIAESPIGSWFLLSKGTLEVALPLYGFIAAVLPVWVLLCPRDYLSTYMKLGTVGLMAVAVIFVAPKLAMPPTTEFVSGGGPIIPGPVWPWVCLTIACGAISGFHALIGSGTTPKMIASERDIVPIGYGAMLVEGFVALIALVAACTLLPSHYLAINVSPDKLASSPEVLSDLAAMAANVGEHSLLGRTGGGVTLAAAMAEIFRKLPGMGGMGAYWYHFVIMFEALFILTTIDTGTRVARFLLQEMLAKVWKPLGRGTWLPGVIVTSFAVSASWWALLAGGTVSSIWPMFGIANQLLGVVALAIGTTHVLLHARKPAYALTTALPCAFMAVTVLAAGFGFARKALLAATPDYLKGGLTVVMMALTVVILTVSVPRWVALARAPRPAA